MEIQQVQDSIQSSLMFAGVIAALSLVAAFVISVFALRYVRRMSGADLAQTGVPAQATVVRLWDTGTTINDHPVAGLELEVRAPAGAYKVTTRSMIPRLATGSFQPGAVVAVRIDPRNPQRVALDLAG